MSRPQAATVTADGSALALGGSLTFATVAATWQQAKSVLRSSTARHMDLAGVTEADSAGLALVLALLADGRNRQPAFAVANAPADLLALARVCDAERWLKTAA